MNGEREQSPKLERGYFVLNRTWKSGDEIKLDLPMPVERIAANPNVKADAGQLAIQRGPLVYCLEVCDNAESLQGLFLPASASLTARKDPGGFMQ